LNDRDIELIPLNFFLYSKAGVNDDYVLADTLVEFALTRPNDVQFAKLAVFAFHLANSGNWRKSEWPNGRVAGWANQLVRDFAWRDGDWIDGAFEKQSLMAFISQHLEGESDTKRKVRNNYRFMLKSAELLIDEMLEPMDFNAQWAIAAPQLFWDRQIFDGALRVSSTQNDFEDLYFKHEIHKLMRCSEAQGSAMSRAAFRDYSRGRMTERFKQLDDLRALVAAAA
jgi:hypothetical protein